MAVKVMCPVCKSEFMTGDGAFGTPVTAEQNGVAYLVPKVIGETPKSDDRMKVLREAGINISKLSTLLQSNPDLKDIFEETDPAIEELSKGGFIRNPELFRRWITAHTFGLLSDPKGWTHAVRIRHNTAYVFKQTKEELELQIKLLHKGVKKDRRFTFFTLEDFKVIFLQLAVHNSYRSEYDSIISDIHYANSLQKLDDVVKNHHWAFPSCLKIFPARWLNCFKGAGSYYTLQNIIRTHGLILPQCKDMNESLDYVESVYNNICSYDVYQRRWDILLSVLTVSVKKTHFELKY